MNCKGHALVFEQQSSVTCGEARHVLAQLRKLCGSPLVPTNGAVCGTAFAAVQSRNEQRGAAKEPVDVGERATRDERHRTVQCAAECIQQQSELSIDGYAIGRRRKFEQRAIDIEKKRAAFIE